MLVHISVWESVEALGAFVYGTRHLDVLRRSREWFEKMTTTYLALWWVPAGTISTVDEAKRRLDLLERCGPSVDAFAFRDPFPPPLSSEPIEKDDRWFCPTG